MKNIEKILTSINIKCIEGCSLNSTKISLIYCRKYFLNILSSNFSEGEDVLPINLPTIFAFQFN
jgi:hypothetical protein